LDNAIDACKRIEQNDKWILLQIEIQKNFLFIKISNSIDEMPVMKKGIPVSTKQNKKRHGYGLKSVERIVNKYNGVITFRIEQNIFEVDISF
jgi:sensor histidine kinase regulating citrate/malate metabolism